MDAVVIGGGVVGLASAYELASAGHSVTLLESGNVGQAASHGNAAKITFGERGPVPAPGVLLQGVRWMMRRDSPLSITPSLSPSYIRFMVSMARRCNERDFREGLELHMRMGEDAKDLLDGYLAAGLEFEMHARSNLLAFETRQRFDEGAASLDICAEFGVVPERLIADEVFEVEPALSDRIRYGLNVKEDRQIEPDSLTSALSQAVIRLGGEVCEHTEATGFVKQGNYVTHVAASDRRVYAADVVVLANGTGLRGLCTQLGVSIQVHPGKGYSLDYVPAPVELRSALTLEDARVAITPLDGFVRLAGTMEFGRYDDRISPMRIEAIRRAAREGLRHWAGNESGERTPWAGLRPMTPDGRPVVGAIGGWQNAYVVGGHGMLGLTLAPSTAKVLVDLVQGNRSRLPRQDLAALDPDRFSRKARRTVA